MKKKTFVNFKFVINWWIYLIYLILVGWFTCSIVYILELNLNMMYIQNHKVKYDKKKNDC